MTRKYLPLSIKKLFTQVPLLLFFALAFINGKAQTISVTAPAAGITLYGCQTYIIKWNQTGTLSDYFNIDYSLNGGAIWTSVASDIQISNSQFSWTVPMVSSLSVLVRVRDFNDTLTQGESGTFAIQLPIIITSPVGGENWQGLTNHTITWNPAGTSGIFDIYYSIDNGTTFISVATNVAANNYNWTVPNNPSTTAIVKVTDASTSCQQGQSPAAFTISAAQPVLISPLGGQNWTVDATKNITWTPATFYTKVKLEYSTNNGTTYNLVNDSAANTGSYAWDIPNTPTAQALVRASNYVGSTINAVSNSTFTISYPGPFLITPNGGEVWRSDNTQTIVWNDTAFTSAVKLEYSLNNGASWTTITTSAPNTGSYNWVVPVMPTTTQALVRITDVSVTTITNTSNAVFTIKAPITLDYPALITDTQTTCNTINISWSKTTAFENEFLSGTCYNGYPYYATYALYYSNNGGAWTSITTVANTCNTDAFSYSWTVPDLVAGTIRFKIIGYPYGSGTAFWQDSSLVNIPLRLPNGTITVTSPTSGVMLNALTNTNITWTGSGTTGYYDVLYSTTGLAGTFTTIASDLSGNSYTWNVTNTPSTSVYFRVQDHNDICRKGFSGSNTINAATPILTSPNGGQVWQVSSVQNITWNSSTLYTNAYLEFSTDSGVTWNVISASAPNTGTYSWTLPNITTTKALVRISNVGAPSNNAVSAAVFTINLPIPILTAPNGGEVWRSDNIQTITWNSSTVSSNVMLEYSINDGATWTTITASTSNTGSYNWGVPIMTTTTQALVRITNVSFPTARDTSHAVFTIKAPITLDYPALITDTQTTCNTININWSKTTAFENEFLSGTCYNGYPYYATYALYYSNNGGAWTSITTVANTCNTDAFSYSWTVPDLVAGTIRFKIIGYPYGSGTAFWQDSSLVNIPLRLPNGTITVTSPTSGVTLNALTNTNITWTASGSTGSYDILYSTTGLAGSYSTIVSGVTGNSYTWNVTNTPSTSVYFRVQDHNDICRKGFSGSNTINAATPILTSPNGGQVWNVSSVQNITWNSNTLYTNAYLQFSTDSGVTWNVISASAPNTGTYSWTLPNIPTTKALVMISNVGAPSNDAVSAAVFTIYLPKPVLTAPNGGEVWRSDNVQTITWNTGTVTANVMLEYSINNGATWTTITTGTSNTGSYNWAVPIMPTTTQALVRITNTSFPAAVDTSNAVFTIKAPITLDYPSLITDTQTTCNTINISWSKTTAFENEFLSGTCYNGYPYYATFDLYYSNNGGAWISITSVANTCNTDAFSYSWTVPDLVAGTIRFKIIGYPYNSGTAFWQDSSLVNIPLRLPNGTITVTSPTSGVTLNALTNTNITWTGSGTTGYYDVLYSTTGLAGTFTTIASDLSGNSYTWNVTNTPSTSVYFRVQDHNDICRKGFSGSNTINAATPILTSPNGGQVWNVSSVQNIAWNSNTLYTGTVYIEFSTDNGNTWNVVSASAPNTGTYAWTVPYLPTTQARIRISDVGAPSFNAVSAAVFTILVPQPVLTAPNGGQVWYAGTVQSITWNTGSMYAPNVRLDYSVDSGNTWINIVASASNTGTYSWTIPNVYSIRSLVRISNTGNLNVVGTSAAVFTLKPYVRIITPIAGNILEVCTQTTITFDLSPVYTTFNIAYSTNNGQTFTAIASNQTYSSGVNSYNWTIPNTPTSQALIWVYPTTATANGDSTDGGNFTIKKAVTVIQPSYGGVLVEGTTYPIKWASDGISNIYNIQYSTTGPTGPWINIITGYNTSTNVYNWTVPSTASGNCYIQITDNINSCKTAVSANAFTISNVANPISVTHDNGGDTLSGCQSYNITWSETGTPIGNYNIYYSTNGGSTYIPIVSNYLTTSGSYPWVVPNINTNTALIEVQSGLNANVYALSNAAFTILPGALTAGPDTSVCQGSPVQMHVTGFSGTYSWSPSASLSNAAISNPVATPGTTTPYTVSVSNGSCVITATATVSVSPLAAGPTVSISASPGNSICNGTQVTFTATPVNGGSSPSYQWKLNGNNVGTNSTIYSYSGFSNNDVVTCVITSNAPCLTSSTGTSNAITMTISSPTVPSVSIAASSTNICSGTSVSFTATPVNGGSNPSYQWELNGTNAGTNSPTFSSTTLNNNDAVACVLTSNAGCVSPASVTSNTLTITVNQTSAPTVIVTSSSNPVCSGIPVTFNAAITNGGSNPAYQWQVDGNNVGTNSSSYVSSTINNGDSVKCVLTSNSSCATITTVTSNKVSMTVNQSTTPTVNISSTSTAICAGQNVLFTAAATNPGTAPVYQWQKNGVNVGSGGTTFSSATLASGDIITVILTSNASCATANPVTSNALTISVVPAVTPTVSISASTSNICPSTSVTFTAASTNGGNAPVYQWQVNGVNAGTNSNSFTSSSLANNAAVTCILTSDAACSSPSTTTSNTIGITVNPVVNPAISITSTASSICSGNSITFNAAASNGGTLPVYQWKVNNTNAGTNSPTFADTNLNNNDIVTCVLTSNAACASTGNATSNGITITVNSAVTPSVSINASANNICSGTQVTFTATPVNGGGNPTYQWLLNGNNVGTNATSYSSASLSNNDVVSMVLTSSADCASPVSVSSNSVTMIVTPAVTPSVSISASATTICTGTSVTFTATPVNGGTTPAYQWKLNGTNVGTNSATFSSNSLNNNDQVSCIMVSDAACASPLSVTSNSVTISVNLLTSPTISINASNTTACAGTPVTFNASVTNPGSNISYQWKVNGTNAGTNTSSFSSTTLSNNDVVTCVLNSTSVCSGTTNVSSNSISMTITPALVPSVSISASSVSICSGQPVVFSSAVTNGGSAPVYQWQINGSNVGTNNASFTSTTLNNNDVVACVLTSDANCALPATANSNTITVTVGSTATPTITIATASNSVCAGSLVSFTAGNTNGGTSPIYQWQVNGANAGTNSSSFSSSSLANGAVVTCQLTSNATCISQTTANSNSLNIIVNPVVTPAVSIQATATTICAGTNITFTANPVNGGNTPAYQWLVNGSNAGSNSNTFNASNLNSGDIITCRLTSGAACPSPATATSAGITMTVNASVIPSVNITTNNNNVCAGTQISFTATGNNGGSNPVYQWQVNGANAGSNSATFVSSTLNNSDVVSCVYTSDAACALPGAATSNTLTMSISPNVVPAVSISGPGTICAGSNAAFNATATNGGSNPGYQWEVNGVNAGSNSATFNSTTLNNNDLIVCKLTSNANCASPTNATSNSIVANVSNSATPSVSISTPTTSVCTGGTTTFTALPVNGGSTPAYQWQVNGTNAGSDSINFTPVSPANGAVISCVLSSNLACASVVTANSNTITLTTSSSVVPAVTVSGNTSVCSGSDAIFTATGTNGGSTPVYQWKVNGTNAGNDSSIFVSNILTSADVVSCVYTSSSQCATPSQATSNQLTVTVQSSSVATAAISVSPSDVVCANANVEFTATLTNAGSSPVTYWQVNGVTVDSNNVTYSSSGLLDGDIVSLKLTSNAACVTQATVVSNTVVMTVHSLPSAPAITQSGDVLTSSTVSGNQWYLADASITGATNRTYTISASGYYRVEVTDSDGCSSKSDSVFAGFTGVTNIALQNAVQILPNPFRDNLFLNISENIRNIELLALTVSDADGRVVYETLNLEHSNTINLKTLAAGVYLLNIHSANESVSFKVVKIE